MVCKFILSFFCWSILSLYAAAQIGINTNNPRALFHVDALGNNNTVATNDYEILDDFVITSDGNVGIGTFTPSKRLHIVTGGTTDAPILGLKIEDGREKANNILTTDVDGNVAWDIAPPPSVQLSTQPATGAEIDSDNTAYVYTGAYIDLDPGKWLITINTLLYAPSISGKKITFQDKTFVHGGFIDKSYVQGTIVLAEDFSLDVENNKRIAVQANKTMHTVMIGSLIINNISSISKRYYYVVGGINQIGTSQGVTTYKGLQGTGNFENSIVALKINTGS